MRLPMPPDHYQRATEIERNRQLEQADVYNHKRGQDVEISPGRLILKSPNGTRWSITVSNAGAISATAL